MAREVSCQWSGIGSYIRLMSTKIPHPLRVAALILGAVLSVRGLLGPAGALLIGVAIAIVIGNPLRQQTAKAVHPLLSLSVIGLGAGMNLIAVAKAGAGGIAYTAIGIVFTLIAGRLIGAAMKVPTNTSALLSVGTAICGGSAIAAVAPVLHAKQEEISVSLGTVFLLNALALLLFPWIGHSLDMQQCQFGLWSALAIHDTSSVVGASVQYGARAAEIGVTVKLARALWIIPVTFVIGRIFVSGTSESAHGPRKKPWFILGFLLMAAFFTWVPGTAAGGKVIALVAQHTLMLTLFFIGANLSLDTIKSVGLRPLAQGVLLWVIVATLSLSAIEAGWIRCP